MDKNTKTNAEKQSNAKFHINWSMILDILNFTKIIIIMEILVMYILIQFGETIIFL